MAHWVLRRRRSLCACENPRVRDIDTAPGMHPVHWLTTPRGGAEGTRWENLSKAASATRASANSSRSRRAHAGLPLLRARRAVAPIEHRAGRERTRSRRARALRASTSRCSSPTAAGTERKNSRLAPSPLFHLPCCHRHRPPPERHREQRFHGDRRNVRRIVDLTPTIRPSSAARRDRPPARIARGAKTTRTVDQPDPLPAERQPPLTREREAFSSRARRSGRHLPAPTSILPSTTRS